MAISTTSPAEGQSNTYNYTGGMQSFTAPIDGIYKLECYGGKGGNGAYGSYNASGGNGGYSLGYIKLTKGTTLYVCVGGAGAQNGTSATYNGGGKGYVDNKSGDYYGSGGGATHIANVTGTLSSIGASNKSKILIVAGGGGGGYANKYSATATGGTGGGTSGGNGSGYGDITAGGVGGTQTTGYAFGVGIPGALQYSGGGGGLYGGKTHATYVWVPSGGGSGYIGGVPSFSYGGTTYAPSTANGKCSGNGVAYITLTKILAIYNLRYNSNTPQKVYYNNVQLNSLVYNNQLIFGLPLK